MGKLESTAKVQKESPEESSGPYPFYVNIVGTDRSYQGQVLKLVIHGMLLEVGDGVLGIGEKATVKFDLPADKGYIEGLVNVIKIYDRKVPAKDGQRTQRIVEAHFVKPLVGESKASMKKFLKAIRQFGSDLV